MAAAFPVGFPYSVPPKPFPTSQSKAENGYSHPNSAKTLKHTVTPLHPLKLHRERITALRACLTKRTGHPTHRYYPRPQTHFPKTYFRTHCHRNNSAETGPRHDNTGTAGDVIVLLSSQC